MRIDNGKNISILHDTGKVKDDGRVYLCKTIRGWYRLYRQGQRSWEAVCVVPKKNADYKTGRGVSIHGNAENIMRKVEEAMVVEEWHMLWHEAEYRKALVAIVATGEIDGVLDVQIIKKGEEL